VGDKTIVVGLALVYAGAKNKGAFILDAALVMPCCGTFAAYLALIYANSKFGNALAVYAFIVFDCAVCVCITLAEHQPRHAYAFVANAFIVRPSAASASAASAIPAAGWLIIR